METLVTPKAYQLEVLKMETSDNVDFLTASDLADNGIIVGMRFKTNKNGNLYISTKNEAGERTQAIYCNKKLSVVSSDKETVDYSAVQFAYITPKDGDLHTEGPNKGQQKEPFFVACKMGTEDEWFSK